MTFARADKYSLPGIPFRRDEHESLEVHVHKFPVGFARWISSVSEGLPNERSEIVER